VLVKGKQSIDMAFYQITRTQRIPATISEIWIDVLADNTDKELLWFSLFSSTYLLITA